MTADVVQLHPHRPTVPGTWANMLESVPGLTPRMLDHWTRTGRLKCVGDQEPGSGRERLWSVEDIPVLWRVLPLARAGIRIDLAFALARGETELLAHDVKVTFTGGLA